MEKAYCAFPKSNGCTVLGWAFSMTDLHRFLLSGSVPHQLPSQKEQQVHKESGRRWRMREPCVPTKLELSALHRGDATSPKVWPERWKPLEKPFGRFQIYESWPCWRPSQQ